MLIGVFQYFVIKRKGILGIFARKTSCFVTVVKSIFGFSIVSGNE